MSGMDYSNVSSELLIELDMSIDDIENGRVTPHAEAMEILKRKYEEYVDQNS